MKYVEIKEPVNADLLATAFIKAKCMWQDGQGANHAPTPQQIASEFTYLKGVSVENNGAEVSSGRLKVLVTGSGVRVFIDPKLAKFYTP